MTTTMMEEYMEDEDVEFEQLLLRSPYTLKTWWNYIEHKRAQTHRAAEGSQDTMTNDGINQYSRHVAALNMVYERAVTNLPGSYKLWKSYLDERMVQVVNLCITDMRYDLVNRVFERALHYMHKMPVIWMLWLRFLLKQRLFTKCRRSLDRALQSLPLTQHDRLWKFAMDEFLPQSKISMLGIHLYQRFLQYDPSAREQFIDYLIEIGEFDRAAFDLHEAINFNALEEDNSTSATHNAKLWDKLSQLIQDHPTDITLINVGRVLRNGLRMKSSIQQHGVLWCALATYFIQMGHFEKVRDVYEEAMEKVNTVADFSQVFDAYSQFEEQLITVKMNNMNDEDEDDNEQETDDGAQNSDLIFTNSDDLDMRFARLEHLMTRRPFLLSNVKLRQNPHNVHEWHKLVKLFLTENDNEQVVKTYLQAIEKLDPQLAIGKPHTIWCAFAKFYEFKLKDVRSARIIFERAVLCDFKTVEELANVWCEYAEMELRNKNYREARALLQRATSRTSSSKQRAKANIVTQYTYEYVPASARLYKSVKLWSLYLDVEESLGTVETTIALYDRCLELKIATVPLIINYANFLEENRYFEHAFKTMERAVHVFPFPQVYHVWIHYLTAFMDRYKSERIERARDLFEEAVSVVPQEFARGIYLLYAKLEEEYGLAKHAMSIYDRATRAVRPEERYELFLIYIARASEFYGVTRTREIYETAIKQLPDGDVVRVCLLYARLERKLGEIDRARAIYAHGSRVVDPKNDEFSYWKTFETFEERHGNMETYKDFLRLRRAVQTNMSMASQSSIAMEKAQAEFEARRRQFALERKEKQRQELLERKMEMETSTGEEQENYENEEEIEIELAPVPDSLFEKNVKR